MKRLKTSEEFFAFVHSLDKTEQEDIFKSKKEAEEHYKGVDNTGLFKNKNGTWSVWH